MRAKPPHPHRVFMQQRRAPTPRPTANRLLIGRESAAYWALIGCLLAVKAHASALRKLRGVKYVRNLVFRPRLAVESWAALNALLITELRGDDWSAPRFVPCPRCRYPG